uniref:uncharacterized protein LOC120335694 n=1 Tax=Styela clava TaxID=7725 RepID=UPI001939DB0F|nr:uncharacterized protein LOC120335694 [Styela clava]
MDIVSHSNRTGVFPGYGIYSPPYEKKAAFPKMLYRGHAVRLDKGSRDSYYQQHVVRKYQMHSLNAGFSGKEGIPLKDQNNFKFPSQRTFCPRTPRGKWTNFPMTVEMGKYTRGFEGKYVANPASATVREKPRPTPVRTRTAFSTRRSVDLPSRPLPSPLDFAMESRLYEEIEPEIIDIMAARNEVFQSYQNRVESALMSDNDRGNGLGSNPVSRLGFTSDFKPSNKQSRARPKTTSFFVEGPNSNLLLPVPFVMPSNRAYRPLQLKQRSFSAPVAVAGVN